MKSKGILRKKYEEILGQEICDRTWCRLRTVYLGIENEYDDRYIPLVEGAALLRRCNASATVNRKNAQEFGKVVRYFAHAKQMTGKDLKNSIAKCFKTCPSRNWFWHRGVKMGEMVDEDKIFFVLAAIISSKKFGQIRDEPAKIRTLADVVQENLAS